MPSGKDIADGIAKYFATPKAAANDGAGDSDTAAAHAAVNKDLEGTICPDCHQAVKGALTTVFGNPANDAQAANEADNMTIKPTVNPLQAIRDPNNTGRDTSQ